MSRYEFCMFIDRPQNMIGLKTLTIQGVPRKKYSFLSASIQEIYISENISLNLPIKIPMKVTGIDLVINEGGFN